MLRVRANDANASFSLNDSALVANGLDGWSDFHLSFPPKPIIG